MVTYTHTHTDTHTYTRTHIHTHTHTRARAHGHTRTHVHTHTHTPNTRTQDTHTPNTHARRDTHTHGRTHARLQSRVQHGWLLWSRPVCIVYMTSWLAPVFQNRLGLRHSACLQQPSSNLCHCWLHHRSPWWCVCVCTRACVCVCTHACLCVCGDEMSVFLGLCKRTRLLRDEAP